MSGILGIVSGDGAPTLAAGLASMMDAMARYGPDAADTWLGPSVALGHRMLYVTPQSLHERLPAGPAPYLALGGRSLQITADCRLDNRRELCHRLSIPAAEWERIPDSQLILAAYAHWGEACPEYLLGDFAFAIWDGDHETLYCARDPMGVRAFYYAQTRSGFRFASDLDALCAVLASAPAVNEFVLKGILLNISYNHPAQTLYAGVMQIPPGHWLRYSARGVQLRQYWRMARNDEIRLADDRAYAEMAVDLLQKAVDCRLRSAFPIGSNLSGGMDSAAVTVMAARRLRQSGRTLATFSWSPAVDEAGYMPEDERPFIAAVCAQEGLTCHYARPNVQEGLKIYQQGMALFARFPIVPTLENARIAQRENIRVMLSGWGGDETISFGSKGYLLELLHTGRWLTLARELPLWARRKQQHPARVAYDLLRSFLMPQALKDRRLPLNARPALSTRYYDAEFVARMAQIEAPLLPRVPEWGQSQFQMHVLKGGHHTARMVAWTAITAEYQLEWRHPLLDRRVIEFALNLPPRLYLTNGKPRYLFNLAMEGIVPDEMLWRNVKDEPARIASSIETRTGAEALYLDWIEGCEPAAYPIVSREGLQRMQAEVRAQRSDNSIDYRDRKRLLRQGQWFDALQAERLIHEAQRGFRQPAASSS